jgi:hypothetical protein
MLTNWMIGLIRMTLKKFREFLNCIELCKTDMFDMRWIGIFQIMDNKNK